VQREVRMRVSGVSPKLNSMSVGPFSSASKGRAGGSSTNS
jgi:hypothetical protein